jgi:hypothetical protein
LKTSASVSYAYAVPPEMFSDEAAFPADVLVGP